MNVRMKKMLVRKHARSEAPLDDRCAMICNRSCDMSYVLVRSLCNKSEWCTMKRQHHTSNRWSDDGACVNLIGRMANVWAWGPSCVCSHVNLGVVDVVWYSAYAPSREEVLVQQHPWFSLESRVWFKNIACLYGLSILGGKWRTTVVQRCKIICDMSYCNNTFMVVQHTHTKVRIILRHSKFVQHYCELTQRCTTLCECSWDPMQQFESPSVASEFGQKSEATRCDHFLA